MLVKFVIAWRLVPRFPRSDRRANAASSRYAGMAGIDEQGLTRGRKKQHGVTTLDIDNVDVRVFAVRVCASEGPAKAAIARTR